jgi:hypothetical protein
MNDKSLKNSLTPITDLTNTMEGLQKELEQLKRKYYELRGDVWVLKKKTQF